MLTSIPVWAWDNDWQLAFIIVPALERNGRAMLVRFDNGVTAPLGRSMVRPRDPAAQGADRPSIGAIVAAGRLLRRIAEDRLRPAWRNPRFAGLHRVGN